MKYYQEIRLLPNSKNNLGFLWQKVYQQIHIAFVENKIGENQSAIGISIPEYFVPEEDSKGFPLGDKIRLFANTEAELESLNIANWLNHLEDYAQIKTIKPVPEHSQYACFSRKHIKGEKRIVEKARQMAEFKAKETGEPVKDWLKKYRQQSAKLSSALPYIQINRSDTEQNLGKRSFKLFIEMDILEASLSGKFNCYGFSHKATELKMTVPWF